MGVEGGGKLWQFPNKVTNLSDLHVQQGESKIE